MFIRTGYSFRNSVGSIEDVSKALEKAGYTHFPIADYANTFAYGYIKDKNPVYGVTLSVTPNLNVKKPVTDDFVFVANKSISQVNDLIKTAYEQFKYVPLLTYDQVNAFDGVVIAGDKARLELLDPRPKTFISLRPSTARGYFEKAKSHGFRFVAMHNNRYPEESDRPFYELLCGRTANLQTYPQHILNEQEWLEIMLFHSDWVDSIELGDALANYKEILTSCEGIEIPRGELLHPQTNKSLKQICEEGASSLGIDLNDPVYKERFETELSVIEEKKFEDYFLIFSDFMRHARKETLCGPARGSAAGSLVCYLAGITSVDPIKYGLLFFRFLDPSRPDYPDIDVDIAAADRDRIINYLSMKYDAERVARLGTIAKFQAKNTLLEVCKGLDIPRYELKALEQAIPDYADGDSRSDFALKEALESTLEGEKALRKWPELKHATRFGGHPRHSSSHAAGVLITDKPINEYVAVSVDRKGGAIISQCDLRVAENMGLLKADLLGLTNLSVFKEACLQAGLPHDYLLSVPLDDPKVFQVLNSGKFNGVFQLEGRAAQEYAKRVHFTTLEDLSAVSAIARPGPMQSGAADQWVRRKNGEEAVSYVHPLFEPYLKETYGLLIYQEQVMLIAREVAGMDWPTVSKLRKAIGKSMGEEAMKPFSKPFIRGLMDKGISEEVSVKFWKDIVGFGKYSFNKSHSISYGIVTYWSLYLKAYFPLEFAAASLTYQKNVEKQINLLRELSNEGITYIPVDPETSTDKWRVVNKNGSKHLVGPISLVDGIGPRMQKEILSARARNEPLPERAQKLLENAVTKVDSLYPIKEALSRVDLAANNVVSESRLCEDAIPNGDWQEDVLVLGLVTLIKERDENEPQRIQDRLERGQAGKYNGETRFVEIRLTDDTGTIYAKIGRKEFATLGEKALTDIVEGETLLAVKGTITPEAPVLLVKNWRILR